LIGYRRATLAWFLAAGLFGRFALGDAYDPPSNYYDYATGTTGTTLKQRLRATIDTVDDAAIPNTAEVIETSMSYDSARSSLQVTDADSLHPGHVIMVYDRTSLDVSSFNTSGIHGWDGGTTWNREHTWPRSRGVNSSGPDDSDLFELRPALTANNGDRGDLNFGGAFGAQAAGTVTDGGQTYWYPGNADAGMIARQQFYMAVRYDGADASTQDLELGTGNVANPTGAEDAPPQLGNLTRLIEWNYAVAPDDFERNRNQVIYMSYQHNRNPFTDHPEWVWSVFKDQANHSQVSIAGATANADGSSTKNVDMGRVFVGGAVPPSQVNTLNKTGDDGTYYSVTTSGAAASSVTGRFNPFAITTGGATVTKSISVGLNTTTATAGVKSGAVTVDNLDITTAGGTGKGANDANDTFNVSLIVLDHAKPSFTTGPAQTTSLTIDLGNVAYGDSATPQNFDVYNIGTAVDFIGGLDLDSITPSGNTSAFATNLAPFATLPKASHQTFTASLNLASVGSFLATYILNTSDENLPGAQTTAPLTLTLKGVVRLAGDYNGDNLVDAQDYIVWQHTLGQSTTKYGGADGDGSLMVDSADYDVWRAHFGQTAPGAGSAQSLTTPVPEPATAWLAAIFAAFVCHRLRRT
jgi:endonuclease I